MIDLRTEPGEMPLQAAQLLTIADLPQGLTHLQLLDTVEVDCCTPTPQPLRYVDCRRLARRGQCGQADPGRSGGSGSVLRGVEACPEPFRQRQFCATSKHPNGCPKRGIPLFITMPKPRLPWCAPAKVLCMRRCSPLLYSETELKKKNVSSPGCPVFYFLCQ